MKTSALFILALSITIPVPSITLSNEQLQQADTSFYGDGEELLYDVSWSGIKIGTIRLQTLVITEFLEAVKHKAVAYIDSRSGLPFVNIHMVAYTEMDSSFNSLGSYSYEKQDGGWQKVTYHYDFLKKRIVVEEASQEALDSSPHHSVVCDTLHIEKIPIQDGISLVFVARHLLQVREAFSYPTVSNEKLGETFFDPLRPRSKVNIKAWEKPIHVVQVSGKMKLEGIFGLTGDYKGWFSDDIGAVPITAEMKVILGTVKIELTQWNHKVWNPPDK
jgi:hypothetical protein